MAEFTNQLHLLHSPPFLLESPACPIHQPIFPNTMTSALFAPLQLRGLTLPNRIVVSPMCQYNSEHGSANDWHLMHLGQFAMGAAGLLITEATHVSPIGRITHRCLGLYDDDNEATLKRVVDFCRRYGVAKLGIQLAHAGRKGSVHPPAAGSSRSRQMRIPGAQLRLPRCRLAQAGTRLLR